MCERPLLPGVRLYVSFICWLQGVPSLELLPQNVRHEGYTRSQHQCSTVSRHTRAKDQGDIFRVKTGYDPFVDRLCGTSPAQSGGNV